MICFLCFGAYVHFDPFEDKFVVRVTAAKGLRTPYLVSLKKTADGRGGRELHMLCNATTETPRTLDNLNSLTHPGLVIMRPESEVPPPEPLLVHWDRQSLDAKCRAFCERSLLVIYAYNTFIA